MLLRGGSIRVFALFVLFSVFFIIFYFSYVHGYYKKTTFYTLIRLKTNKSTN